MRLTPEQVEHIAALCRIAMTAEEQEHMRDQLSSILEQFEALQRLDTAQVQPSSHAVAVQSVFREDEARPSLPQAEVLANAPRQEDGYLRIKAVLEE